MAVKDETIQMSCRVEPSLIDRADNLIEYISAKRGFPVKRADVWREALIAGLREIEKRAEKEGSW